MGFISYWDALYFLTQPYFAVSAATELKIISIPCRVQQL
jgi:hypothetical protein